MPEVISEPVLVCSGCQAEHKVKKTAKGERIPQGWKRHGDSVYCRACWKKAYRLRAVAFPVAEVLGASWQDLDKALKLSWGLSTHLSNWAITELAKADVVRSPRSEKLDPMPKINLYRLWQEHAERPYWQGAAQSANSILHTVEAIYRKKRYDLVWRNAISLDNFRYPRPYPVHNQAWRAAYREYTGKDGSVSKVPTISVPLAGRRFTLRLAGGSRRYHQLKAFGQIVRGEAITGELAIYRMRASGGDHRASISERPNGGGARVTYRIMVKLVAWLPRTVVQAKRQGSLEVRTASNSLWLTFNEDAQRSWTLHVDHMRRRIAAYRNQLQRLADDTKAELRMPSWQKRQMLDRINVLKERQHHRLSTFCHTAARMLADYAARCEIAELIYFDDNRKYFKEFPWQRLRLLLEDKLDEHGILFVYRKTTDGSQEYGNGDLRDGDQSGQGASGSGD